MGKQIILFLALFSLLGFNPVSAASFNFIPKTTSEIAKQAEVKEVKAAKQYSDIVRVGIGNSAFSSYVYKTAGIYGTNMLEVYSGKTRILNVAPNKNVNIFINSDGSYTLKDDLGKQLAKVSNSIKFSSPGGSLGVKGLSRAGKPALYHGDIVIIQTPNGVQFNIVNELPVETYLKGVVPNEMPVSFGLEALKAQSIAARNYVLSPRVKASPNYDVVDSVASQVYFGANTEKILSNQAVEETNGLVALYDWDLILAQYSSTAGGYTESYSNAFSDPVTKAFPSADKPYLKAKPDILTQGSLSSEAEAEKFYKSSPESYDMRSSYYRWTREWSADELKTVLEKNLPAQSATGFVKPAFNNGEKLGELIELKVKKRGESGKIVELEIITDTKTYKVYKELVIRRLLTKYGKALPSANMVFENSQDNEGKLVSIKAFGGGFGHGVGMSQYGAGFMGNELHLSFDKILQHYYSGIIIGTKPVIVSSDNSQNSIGQTFYAPHKKANIVIDNKFQLGKLNVSINGKAHTFELPVSIFGGNRCVRLDISPYINVGKNTILYTYPAGEPAGKAVRLFVELVEKNDNESIW